MTILKSILAALFAVTLLIAPAKADEPHVIAIIDTSGVVDRPGEAREMHKLFFAYLSEMQGRSATRRAKIQVITTTAPDIAFEGTPLKVTDRFDRLLAATEISATGCSELVRAFRVADRLVLNSRSDDIRVFVISSLYNTGAPCNSVISRPQEVPTDIDPARFFSNEHVTMLEFFWVDRFQWQDTWYPAFSEAYKAADSDATFGMYTPAQTLERLYQLATGASS